MAVIKDFDEENRKRKRGARERQTQSERDYERHRTFRFLRIVLILGLLVGLFLGAVVIFDYQFSRAAQALRRAKLPIVTLTNFETMIDEAMDNGILTQADADTLAQWHSDPENWVPAGFDSVD